MVMVHLFFFIAREVALIPQVARSQKENWPAGTLLQDDGNHAFRDFHLHRAFIERIWGKIITRPYTQEGQTEIFKNWIPTANKGLPHPYSPTAAILLAPFLWVNAWTAYYLFAAINFALLLVLFWFYLANRARNTWELASYTIMGASMSAVHTIAIGQTAIVTIAALALLWHVLYDPHLKQFRRIDWEQDTVLALILFFLSAKPQMAFVAGLLVLSARAWRAAAFGVLLFTLNFAAMLPYYGGWPTALTDYFHFLRNYNKDAMGPFFQWCFNYEGASDPAGFLSISLGVAERSTAFICQWITLAASAIVLILAWIKKIAPAATFQLVLVTLLVAAPYLRTSEDIAVALVIAEGCILGFQKPWVEALKLLSLFLLLNLDPFFNYGYSHYPLKLVLFAIVTWGWWRSFPRLKNHLYGQA